VREGVLRRHRRRADGTFRDTVVFSVLADEWPQVRAGLEARIARASDVLDARDRPTSHAQRDPWA
jgi:hypothetical protein